MATLTASKIVETGTTIASYTTCNTGGADVFVNTGIEFIQVQNNHGSGARTVTVAAVTTDISDASFGVLKKINVVKTIAAGQSAFIGPFPISAYNSATGQVSITYSDSAADMKIIVLYVG